MPLPTVAVIALVAIAAGIVIGHFWGWTSATEKADKPEPETQPTRYSTEPITFAVESHLGKFVVIAKSRNDRTVVREKDIMPMADELRKHREYLAVVNEVSDNYAVKVEETTANEPPDPEALPEGKAKGDTAPDLNPTSYTANFTEPTLFDHHPYRDDMMRALHEDAQKLYAEQRCKHYLVQRGMKNDNAAKIAAQYVVDAERRGIPVDQWGP